MPREDLKRKKQSKFSDISLAIKGLREYAPPSVRKILNDYGDYIIFSYQVCREPVYGLIEKALNLFSLGQVSKAKLNGDFDKLYHLYTKLDLRGPDGTRQVTLRLEKNQVMKATIQDLKDPQSACIPIDLHNRKIKLIDLFFDAEPKAPSLKSFYVYSARDANCQHFTLQLLQGHNLETTEATKFILQPIEKLVKGPLDSIANFFTGLAHKADIIFHGSGYHDTLKRIISREVSYL